MAKVRMIHDGKTKAMVEGQEQLVDLPAGHRFGTYEIKRAVLVEAADVEALEKRGFRKLEAAEAKAADDQDEKSRKQRVAEHEKHVNRARDNEESLRNRTPARRVVQAVQPRPPAAAAPPATTPATTPAAVPAPTKNE